jgi:hypothetical protein
MPLRTTCFILIIISAIISATSVASNVPPRKNFGTFTHVTSYTDLGLIGGYEKTDVHAQLRDGTETVVRIHGGLTMIRAGVSSWKEGSAVSFTSVDSICGVAAHAYHGQTAPNTGGGTLSPAAFFNPSTVNPSGMIAFYSQVSGSLRNQGIFVADSAAIGSIAIGCGSGGGSGDPGTGCGDASPLGGTFSGFFGGTFFTPDINDSGDVLFLCDVDGGSAPRGLFLYWSTTQEIVTIAAVGDPSPLGGTFGAVGPGSVNNNGKVVFLASPVGLITSDIFMWDNGTVTKVAAAGDPAPGGGTFSLLGTESLGFVDGTSIPVGPVPDINGADQICFRAIATGGITDRGIIVRTGGVDEWYVKVPDATPIGGTFFDMQAASLNDAGEIAFFSDYKPDPSSFNSGWFAGAPGSMRKVIVFYDSLDGGQCLGLAFSRNPLQTIDADGNVVFWTDISGAGVGDRSVIGLADGSLLIAARRGDPTPIGGTIGTIDAWPAVDGSRGTLNAGTPGGSGGALSAHMVYTRCTLPVAVSESEPIPGKVALAQNYPNPFNAVSNFEFEISRSTTVSLKVYDLLGREAATILEGVLPPGRYVRRFDATGLSSGVYFYRLTAGDFVRSRKLVLLR